MKYSYKEGVIRPRRRRWLLLSLVSSLLCVYVVSIVLAPTVLYVLDPADRTAKVLLSSRPAKSDTTLYLPKLNVIVKVIAVTSHEAAALEEGAIQRATESGDPETGGNYVLVAHQLNIGLTPHETYTKSPLYHIARVL